MSAPERVAPTGAAPDRVGVVACGALALHVRSISDRRGWKVDVHPLPPVLHNRPGEIPEAVRSCLDAIRPHYARVAVAFADCGTGGDLDRVLDAASVDRLRGDTCYDVLGRDEVRAALEAEPGTYFLTDFLVRTFERTVVRSLGLDRYPDLRDSYFRHYTRALWLAQRPTSELHERAEAAAQTLGLRLEVQVVGESGLERQLESLVA
jgi:hypothetical protein